MRMLEVRYVAEHSLRGERGPRLLRYLLEHGADEFSIAVMALQDAPAPFADAFEDAMEPFAKAAERRRVVYNPDAGDLARTVRLWALTPSSLQTLLTFLDDGIFHCPAGPDGWLEDLTLYRSGELVLGLVSHEQEGVLRLTREELTEVAALGMPFESRAEGIGY